MHVQNDIKKWLPCILITILACMATESPADKIFLRDGSVETSERVWESEHYVHFILQGTKDVEIRYAKEIVERIEGNPSMRPKENSLSVDPEKKSEEIDASTTKAQPSARPADRENPVSVSHLPSRDLERFAKVNRGLSFYDPRRPYRYWAMRNSKHKELTAALNALAKPYGRSTKWVEDHMGQENDLGKIHQHLLRQIQKESSDGGDATPVRKKQSPPKMDAGDDDHDNMVTEEQRSPSTGERGGSGIRFYDPRRAEKYWSSPVDHHHTLQEALASLAKQYGVSPEWIETHMGETNDLAIIHRNIEKNLTHK